MDNRFGLRIIKVNGEIRVCRLDSIVPEQGWDVTFKNYGEARRWIDRQCGKKVSE